MVIAMNNWKYYNHALIPTKAPHEDADLEELKDGSIWNSGGKALLARWTSDFDCEDETEWWYVIKDTPFDISALKSKRRYEIKKGIGNFDVRIIDPMCYPEELYSITVAAFSSWPSKYRPSVEHDSFVRALEQWSDALVYGAFSKSDDKMCGYAFLKKENKCFDFQVLRVIPSYENQAINAAIVAAILEDQRAFIENGGYICDGARSIRHETAFQDYLEKYFGFRKAYCKLHVEYRKSFGWIIKIAYPFRKIVQKLRVMGPFSQLSAILTMEELIRRQKA